jgi:uncharacterized protein (TIGR03435 family)
MFLISLLLAPILAFGQAASTALTFEVATVKVAQPPNPAAILAGQPPHVGVNVQGTRVDIGFLSLAELIPVAYKVKSYQVSGPDWMKGERFDILAKMPDGSDKDQMPEMLQTLLAERFQLKIHRETHEDGVYALVVAKGGPKLKEAEADPETPPAGEPAPGTFTLPNGGGRVKIEAGGATVVSPQTGTTRMSMTPDGHMRIEMGKVSMSAFAEMLNRFVDKPVMDMTDLKGNYQVALDLSMDSLMSMAQAAGLNVPLPGRGGVPGAPAASDPSGGSSVLASVQQLGLRLEPRKAPLEYIVVDHVEKTPTEN